MKYLSLTLLLLVGCGHRAELAFTHVAVERHDTQSVVTLDVLCKAEVGTSCKSLGDWCVTAEWLDGGAVVDTAKQCRPNTLKQGDSAAVRIASTRAIPKGASIQLALAAADPNATKGVHQLPRQVVSAD